MKLKAVAFMKCDCLLVVNCYSKIERGLIYPDSARYICLLCDLLQAQMKHCLRSKRV